MIEESKKLIKYMGVPIVQASSEGEAQSAYLVEKGDAWAIASQDYDTLLFGGQRLLRNFAVSRSKKVKDTKITLDIEYVSLLKLLENLKISREQLIEMGILIGVDFYPGIKGIGQHTALELIRKHGSIEQMVKNKVTVGKKGINIDTETIQEVKDIFLNPDVNTNYPKLLWGKIDYDKIEELLIESHDFSKQRVEGALDRLKKIDSSKVQVSLDSFFKKK
jgi:flap endonuclease-1